MYTEGDFLQLASVNVYYHTRQCCHIATVNTVIIVPLLQCVADILYQEVELYSQLGWGWFKLAACTEGIRAVPRRMKQRSKESLQTTFLCYSNAKSTLNVLLKFSKVEKTKLENF